MGLIYPFVYYVSHPTRDEGWGCFCMDTMGIGVTISCLHDIRGSIFFSFQKGLGVRENTGVTQVVSFVKGKSTKYILINPCPAE